MQQELKIEHLEKLLIAKTIEMETIKAEVLKITECVEHISKKNEESSRMLETTAYSSKKTVIDDLVKKTDSHQLKLDVFDEEFLEYIY